MPRRKSDKHKLLEGRSSGEGVNYVPWIKIHEFGSKSRTYRTYSWKFSREYTFLSDLEFRYFLLLQWRDDIIEVREQYPLLPIEQTLLIAHDLGFKHGPATSKEKKIMSSDFLIRIKDGHNIREIVRTVKYSDELKDRRTTEKLMIERDFWKLENIDWGIITEKDVPYRKAQNLAVLCQSYFWIYNNGFDKETSATLISKFLELLRKHDFEILQTTNEFDKENNWKIGESLNLFKFLLARKVILTDLDVELNFRQMNIWLNEDVVYAD